MQHRIRLDPVVENSCFHQTHGDEDTETTGLPQRTGKHSYVRTTLCLHTLRKMCV